VEKFWAGLVYMWQYCHCRGCRKPAAGFAVCVRACVFAYIVSCLSKMVFYWSYSCKFWIRFHGPYSLCRVTFCFCELRPNRTLLLLLLLLLWYELNLYIFFSSPRVVEWQLCADSLTRLVLGKTITYAARTFTYCTHLLRVHCSEAYRVRTNCYFMRIWYAIERVP
jgi:hypothetical protein